MDRLEAPLTRNRLEEFIAFRKAARHQEAWLNAKTEHASQPDAPIASTSTVPPPWIRALEHFSDLESTISSRIDRLHRNQSDFFAPKFISSEEEEQQQKDIEKHSQDVQKLLKELERMVLTGVRPADVTNYDEVCAAKNVQKHLTTRLTALMAAFRDGQQLFADQLKKRDAKVKKFRQIGSAEVHQKLEREEKVAQYLELGYSQIDIQELLAEDARQQEISAEVQNILESIQELHEMFKDLNAMVVDQGTVLDRIDYNIMKASTNVKAGNEQLTKAREHQKACTMQ